MQKSRRAIMAKALRERQRATEWQRRDGESKGHPTQLADTEGPALGVHGCGLQPPAGAAVDCSCHINEQMIANATSESQEYPSVQLLHPPLQESCGSMCLRSSGSSEPDCYGLAAFSTMEVLKAAALAGAANTQEEASKHVFLCRPFETSRHLCSSLQLVASGFQALQCARGH